STGSPRRAWRSRGTCARSSSTRRAPSTSRTPTRRRAASARAWRTATSGSITSSTPCRDGCILHVSCGTRPTRARRRATPERRALRWRSSVRTLALSPHGVLHGMEGEDGDFDAAARARVEAAFDESVGAGLFHLGAVEVETALPPTYAYFRDLARDVV